MKNNMVNIFALWQLQLSKKKMHSKLIKRTYDIICNILHILFFNTQYVRLC